MKPKKVQAGPKVPCPKCGKPISKRGLNGHQYTCKGPAKPEAPRPASSPGKPSGASGNSTVSFDSMMAKEIAMQQSPEGKLEPAVPTIEELQAKSTIDAKAWSGIFWLIGDVEDGVVDEVIKRYPDAVIKKCNLSQARADKMGELAYAVVGPCKPEVALLGYIVATFIPPLVGILIAVLPKEMILKFTGGLSKYTSQFMSKLKPPVKPDQNSGVVK